MQAVHDRRLSLDQLRTEDKTHSMQLSISGQLTHRLAFFFFIMLTP